MNGNLYELIALGARYLFAVIMIIIVIRAWKITIIDSRRANSLRRLSPETGVCGEFLVIAGSGKVREGMRFPVIREGLIGSSRKADIRLRCDEVHRAHAFFELTKSGLRLRANGGSRMYNSLGESRKELILGDGGKVTFGQVELMLILTEGTASASEPMQDDIFGIPDDSPAFSRRRPEPSPQSRSSATASSPLRRSEQPAQHRERMFRDDIEIKSPPSRKSSSDSEPIDLFLERNPSTVRPESRTPWDDDDDTAPAKVWDDWDDTPAKPNIKRRQYDDPFDV